MGSRTVDLGVGGLVKASARTVERDGLRVSGRRTWRKVTVGPEILAALELAMASAARAIGEGVEVTACRYTHSFVAVRKRWRGRVGELGPIEINVELLVDRDADLRDVGSK